jgi:septum formation protein
MGKNCLDSRHFTTPAVNPPVVGCVRILPVPNPVLVLASNSPRRRELLALTGWTFEVRPAEVDERPRPGEPPADYVLRLAEGKARAVASGLSKSGPDRLILAADTIVTLDGQLLGKPASPAEAAGMLRQLRGRSHQVCSGLALLRFSDGMLRTDFCVTDVPMRTYTDREIETYVASGDPLDKAGAYAIQHAGFHPVENFSGCFASVMGLPLCHLQRSLLRFALQTDLPARCQAHLEYACPVSAAILGGQAVH